VFDRLITYTYDSNPPGGVNPRLASRVADSLAVENVRVDHSPGGFAEHLEAVVRATDGMVQWNTLFNLAAVFDVPEPSAPVVMEGLEGSLLGRHLNPVHFECDSVAESTYRSEAKRDAETVARLLDVDAEPLATLREAGERIQRPTFTGKVMDAHFQNYYARMALASNAVPRTQVGTRVPYVDGPFLEQAARMPLSYREKTFPLTDGAVPYGITRPKLVVMRLLDDDLAGIPYEKTRLPPSSPFPAHVAGFVGTTAWNRLRSTYTYGGPSRLDDWYRQDDTFRQLLDGYVDDLCDRSFVDADAVRELQREHHAEEGHHVGTLAPLTTVEIWLQAVVESASHANPVLTGP
jgi:asparagine synthase (glutamine-hydrolysing)